MAHHCIDWTATPPVRKMPFLVLTRGDDHVYTTVPKELKTLEQVARREFCLGDADIKFSSACANLCNGRPARITETAWEHISPFIGCITVEVSDLVGVADAEAPAPVQLPCGGIKRKLPMDADEEEENKRERLEQGPSSKPTSSVGNTVLQNEHEAEDGPSDRVSGNGNGCNGRDGASAAEDQREEPSEMEASPILQRKWRARRRLAFENGDDSEASEQEHQAPAGSQVPPASSSPRPSLPEIKEEIQGCSRSRPDTEVAEPLQEPSNPIKREKEGSASRPNSHDGPFQPKSQSETGTQSQPETIDNQKLMIRVAHRPSHQESKFTTKSTTRVGKVLAGVCKSFGLDTSCASLYLIVSTEDEDGEQENLFPCDKNDSITRAGAERDIESRFLLKMAGEA